MTLVREAGGARQHFALTGCLEDSDGVGGGGGEERGLGGGGKLGISADCR